MRRLSFRERRQNQSASGPLPFIGVSTPGYNLTGRRLIYWSSSNLAFSNIPFSNMPGLTSGWPIAPSSIESNLRSSAIALSGSVSPVLLYLSPPKSKWRQIQLKAEFRRRRIDNLYRFCRNFRPCAIAAYHGNLVTLNTLRHVLSPSL